MVILSPCLNPMPPTPHTHTSVITSLVVSPCFRLAGMAASDVSAGNQHMLITVSGFGTRRRRASLFSAALAEWRSGRGGESALASKHHACMQDVIQIRQLKPSMCMLAASI